MDTYLVNYLASGKAWVLVGSGPSIQQGYPTWERLATDAMTHFRSQTTVDQMRPAESALKSGNYPHVFEVLKDIAGGARLIEALRNIMDASAVSAESETYQYMARWPVPVYLTTNYEDSISDHLSKISIPTTQLGNSEDDMAMLRPGFSGAVVKLHGTLRSEKGLILTDSQYNEILHEDSYAYWRTKMTSICQMVPLIIIGHSLTDPNIQHVLEAAKQGSGVVQPVCWIAPDATNHEVREYLEKYRIRVIRYSNADGRHKNLSILLRQLTEFIPPREHVRFNQTVDLVTGISRKVSAAAPGLYVFNMMSKYEGRDWSQGDVIWAAIKGGISELQTHDSFSVEGALAAVGWPTPVSIDDDLKRTLVKKMSESKLFEVVDGDRFVACGVSDSHDDSDSKTFEHLQGCFRQSIVFRARREFPSITAPEELAEKIDDALVTYFERGGLSLSSALFSAGRQTSPMSSSVLEFIVEASTLYDDLLRRQAFCAISVDIFAHANNAEAEYLGRLAQGFFAFHAMGVFGEVAKERLSHAASTVWVVDSNIQIGALARASVSSESVRNTLTRLVDTGVRLFTLELLFEETYNHWRFAQTLVKRDGAMSQNVLAAAKGDLPYRKANAFLEGFINWQGTGNAPDWEQYMFYLFGTRSPDKESICDSLCKLGIETVPYSTWPGFETIRDFGTSTDYEAKITSTLNQYRRPVEDEDLDLWTDPQKKARPEAQAMTIVEGERQGSLSMLATTDTTHRDAWFVSDTSILNTIADQQIVTMPTSSFLQLISNIGPAPKTGSEVFGAVVMCIARSGISLLSNDVARSVFSNVIDESNLLTDDQREAYQDSIREKYGEPIEDVLNRVDPLARPLATVQLAHEVAMNEIQARKKAEAAKDESEREKNSVKKDLQGLERFRAEKEARKQKARRRQRKNQPKKKKKKR